MAPCVRKELLRTLDTGASRHGVVKEGNHCPRPISDHRHLPYPLKALYRLTKRIENLGYNVQIGPYPSRWIDAASPPNFYQVASREFSGLAP